MDKIAVITGAAGGIGSAMCNVFSEAGYNVIATDINEPTQAQYTEFLPCDLEEFSRSDTSLHALISKIRKLTSKEGLNVLINNAALQILASTKNLSRDDWLQTLNVNLTAPFLLSQALCEDIAMANGSIINISSVHARATKPGFVAYATSKAALSGLTHALAVDLGPNIRVNAISPAATSTPMLLAGFEGKEESYAELEAVHPIGRIAEPEEIANLALFLASPKTKFITGASIDIDGGILSRLHDPE